MVRTELVFSIMDVVNVEFPTYLGNLVGWNNNYN